MKTIHGLDEYSVSQIVEHFPMDMLAKISERDLIEIKIFGAYLGPDCGETQILGLELCSLRLQNGGGL